MADDTRPAIDAATNEALIQLWGTVVQLSGRPLGEVAEWLRKDTDALIAAVRAENALAEQACRIAAHQLNGRVHELTCGLDSRHAPLVPFVKDGRIALRCLGSMTGITPTPCPYVQDWVPPVAS